MAGVWQVLNWTHTGTGNPDCISNLDMFPDGGEHSFSGIFEVVSVVGATITVSVHFDQVHPPVVSGNNSPHVYVCTEGALIPDNDTFMLASGNYTWGWDYLDESMDWIAGDTWTFNYEYVPVVQDASSMMHIIKQRLL